MVTAFIIVILVSQAIVILILALFLSVLIYPRQSTIHAWVDVIQILHSSVLVAWAIYLLL